jgi:hypothetical protein
VKEEGDGGVEETTLKPGDKLVWVNFGRFSNELVSMPSNYVFLSYDCGAKSALLLSLAFFSDWFIVCE